MFSPPATEVGVHIAATPVLTAEQWLGRHGITLDVLSRSDAEHLRAAGTKTP